MALLIPCNSCISLCRKPEFNRHMCSSKSDNNYYNSLKFRRKITSELQTTAGVSGVVHEFLVPEDQYILHTAEAQNISLPFACRHGCCTSCAVRVKNGQLRQPEALGISAELKEKGYALLCVGFPSSDLEVETQDEDEVYWLQFGRYFARGPVERDDYALELAMGDE
ncbi:Ferredoxin [Quillaja saponaria]|uniref:Ferredoxin n=1 Tax=Quillaja saponaria TaxID=32244 RepID=A0AAD7L6S6_QUISA|nr:Ferredoxin [Quillaja saponaria]